MKDRQVTKKIAYGVLTVVVFALFMFAGQKICGLQRPQKVFDRRIMFFGDSQIAACRDDTSVTNKLSGLLGEEVYGTAFGGTSMSYTKKDNRLAYTRDCYNMVGLSASILTGDFRIQKNARVTEPATTYFEDEIRWLQYMDFSKTELVFIQHAVNDYQARVPVENDEDPYDSYSYAGALRTAVSNLKKANPDLRIILVSPTYVWYPEVGKTCENYVMNGQILEDFVKKQQELAKELDLEFIDLYHDLYEHSVPDDWMKYSDDGLHPNETGRSLMAERIAEYLRKDQEH